MFGHTGGMKTRIKLSGAPLAYTLALVEGTADEYKAFGTALWSDDRVVPATLKELVFMRSSIINQCASCLSGHVVSARRRGVTDEQIDALDHPDRWGDVFDEATMAALELANALCGPMTHELDAGLVESLRAHFDESELAELILVCGQANLNNRAGNAAKQLLGP